MPIDAPDRPASDPVPRKGPLASLRVVEFAGLGPVPLAGQILADLGAEVVIIDRASGPGDPHEVNRRGKRSIALDLKTPAGRGVARDLATRADILLEGFRPGVLERLSLGPDDLDDRLIYGRMTGWGQDGPLAMRAGHDITYLALTGALSMIGEAGRPPVPPLNLVADYGGGAMFLVSGCLAALVERGISGKGQVVDAAMIDGVPVLMSMLWGWMGSGEWSGDRGENLLDGGAPHYRTYACADGRFVAVGALEPAFHAQLLSGLGLAPDLLDQAADPANWPELAQIYAAAFAQRSRDDWAAIFAGTDACVAPVLTPEEAPDDPHNRARGGFSTGPGGATQPAPAPRFSRSVADPPAPPPAPGSDGEAILESLGLGAADIAALRAAGALT